MMRVITRAIALLLILAVQVGAQAATVVNPHGTLREECSTCHRPDAWKPARISATFVHAPKTFPLTGAHARTECTACHQSLEFSKAAKTCVSCHNDVHKGELGTECAKCHTAQTFAETPAMRRAHELTQFPLRGAHATVACESCHPSTTPGQLQFVNRTTTCMGCHAPAYRAAKSPDHLAGGFPTDCASCHTLIAWTGAKFDHSLSLFPLTGAHRTVTCAGCHGDGIYKGKPTTCASCHQTDYNATKTPPHAAAAFPTTCETCHTTTAWPGALFDHNTTHFPLTGAHLAATCTDCHADNVYVGKPTTCVSCHQTDFNGARTPPHAAAGFSTSCGSCHSTTKWLGATFDHSTTHFPLTGAHLTATCTDCHADNVYVGKPTTCVSCHQTDFNGANTPPHAASGFPTSCETCHTTTQWTGAVFNHASTRFPLTGKHVTTACSACHGDGVYVGKPTTCVSCHLTDYNGTTNPKHSAAGYSTSCETCHGTADWTGAAFDHSATQFPLTGAHLTVTCAQCHGDGVFKGKPTACESCHMSDYTATQTPPHASSGFPTTCITCHTTTQWLGATFNHSTTTFPLTGAHLSTSCDQCHGDGVYKGKPTACVSCHQVDYNATANPPHASAGFPTSCTTCHTTTQWLGAVFNHSTTAFPLTGKHATATCNQCHTSGVYKGLPATCVSCHLTDYNGTNNPPHTAAGFGQTCDQCHNTTSWPAAVFDHSTTQFPLTGAHLAAACNQCHASGVYKGLPTTCVSCHQTDYNATTSPPHASSGFPTTCTTCHTTTQWLGAIFDHTTTAFPLTGVHVTTPCTQCHVNGVYKGTPTDCYSCHTTDYNATTNPNHVAAMFPNTCVNCHTTSTWLGATFNHDQSWFPIYSGNHKGRWVTCSDCHTSPTNFAVFTCLTCHTQSKTDADHRGKTGYKYDSNACYQCHPRGSG